MILKVQLDPLSFGFFLEPAMLFRRPFTGYAWEQPLDFLHRHALAEGEVLAAPPHVQEPSQVPWLHDAPWPQLHFEPCLPVERHIAPYARFGYTYIYIYSI